MAKENLFDVADFPIVKMAKQTCVKCEQVKENYVVLNIDDVLVTIKKGDSGHLTILCSCDFCGRKGIAKRILCRRYIRAVWYLIQHNGRITELDVEVKK